MMQALRNFFRPALDPAADGVAQRERTLQEAQQIVQRTHATIFETLTGIDLDQLDVTSEGRVRCAPEHRDALRTLIVEHTPLPDGTPLPWRLRGGLPRAVREVRGRWPQATQRLREVMPEAGLPAPGIAALIEFLRCASDTAQAAPWLTRTPVGREADFLADLTRGELLRVATWPNAIHIAFEPLPAADVAVYGALTAFARHLETNAPEQTTQEIRA